MRTRAENRAYHMQPRKVLLLNADELEVMADQLLEFVERHLPPGKVALDLMLFGKRMRTVRQSIYDALHDPRLREVKGPRNYSEADEQRVAAQIRRYREEGRR